MDLLTFFCRLPLMPVRGVIRLAEMVRDEAERQLHDPAEVRRQLEETERARASGEISEAAAARAESQAIGRLAASPGAASPGEES